MAKNVNLTIKTIKYSYYNIVTSLFQLPLETPMESTSANDEAHTFWLLIKPFADVLEKELAKPENTLIWVSCLSCFVGF